MDAATGTSGTNDPDWTVVRDFIRDLKIACDAMTFTLSRSTLTRATPYCDSFKATVAQPIPRWSAS